ncbi:MAG: carbonic anhydrase, partial [Gammaproteobacteria bacterium]|nr:carbonic anhydrase [Gammaproteobacteria bacterium]
ISAIVDRIQPSIEPFRSTDVWNNREMLIHESMRANVRASVNQLRHGSAVLEELIANEGLLIVGAEYCLQTGTVTFFDHVPKE